MLGHTEVFQIIRQLEKPVVGAADVELDPMLSCHSSKCQNKRVNGSCVRWKVVVREMDKADTEFEKLLQLLHVTFSLAFDCQCVLNVLKELVETMQAGICREWGAWDFPTDPVKHSRPLMGASTKDLLMATSRRRDHEKGSL